MIRSAPLIDLASTEGEIVLDFFAGSAPLAEAVLRMNAEKASRRTFIMVQLPEKTDDNSEAFKAGYRTIAQIGRERIRRAGSKISDSIAGQLSLNESGKLDVGFRAFRLDRSNFNVWNGQSQSDEDLGRQIEMHIDHLSDSSSPEDVLYGLLLKSGFPLTTDVKKVELAGKPVFSIEDGAMLICLERDITPELIDALAEANPLQVICLDEGFKGNDQLKANAVQTFKARAEVKESEIVFKTV